MKNSLLNMVLVLGGISLVASAGVGYVYKITEEPIAVAKAENDRRALMEVLPEFTESRADTLTLDGLEVVVNTASNADEVVGYAVKTLTQQGFSGKFQMMVGFTPDGKVRAVKILEHAETPGLGSKMADEGNVLFRSFEGRNPAEMNLAVRKDGGDVDALTAATITSRAYVDAVARAFNAKMQIIGGASVDASTGATQTNGDWNTGSQTDEGASKADSLNADSLNTGKADTLPQPGCAIENDRKEASHE